MRTDIANGINPSVNRKAQKKTDRDCRSAARMLGQQGVAPLYLPLRQLEPGQDFDLHTCQEQRCVLVLGAHAYSPNLTVE
jgi:hypothetical protein